ncbi:MAG: sugar transferase [Clostridia bacterium]|nr:sugar transferase [Clostridia bacterium]
MYRKFFKRFFDIILSLLAIIVTALPLLIICIVVKCDSKGPAIFKSQRIGKDGKVFNLYKVRSMTSDAPDNMATRHIDGKKYITKVGRFLRKSSLDELPQFFNVLKGDMSIIGPRPACLCEDVLHQLRFQKGVYAVRPGITGLAQVNGRDVLALDSQNKVELDEKYVEKITFCKDLKIFFKTFIVVFKAESVVEGHGAETEPAVEITPEEISERYGQGVSTGEPSVREEVEEVAVAEVDKEPAVDASEEGQE